MWILIDNYDSFSHILWHYLLAVHKDVRVIRNDELPLEAIIAMQPERIILSPGPCTPQESGITMPVIAYYYDKIPLLGICLGHQALGMFYGGQLRKAVKPVHGKTSTIHQTCSHPIFQNIPKSFEVMRYHSLIIEATDAKELQPLAFSETDQALMAFSHKHYPSIGIQFHPESVLTEYGMQIISNWNQLYRN
jgi:anthranilate synthase/aminodeoxychorismate synthase-like glutamine amidotransferase